jgi:hypothetical protein
MDHPNIPITDSSRLRTHIDLMAAQAVEVAPDASSRHLHNGLDTQPPADLHGSYTNNRPLPTKGIADRHTYIVGSGIGGLTAAFFLIRNGHRHLVICRLGTVVDRRRQYGIDIVKPLAPVRQRHVIIDADEIDVGVRPERVEVEEHIAAAVGGVVPKVFRPVGCIAVRRSRLCGKPHRSASRRSHWRFRFYLPASKKSPPPPCLGV